MKVLVLGDSDWQYKEVIKEVIKASDIPVSLLLYSSKKPLLGQAVKHLCRELNIRGRAYNTDWGRYSTIGDAFEAMLENETIDQVWLFTNDIDNFKHRKYLRLCLSKGLKTFFIRGYHVKAWTKLQIDSDKSLFTSPSFDLKLMEV